MARPWIDLEGWEEPAGEGPERPQDGPRTAPEALRAVLWVPIRCPYCGAEDCPVTSSGPPVVPRVRYHACRGCGSNFKSLEAPRRGQK